MNGLLMWNVTLHKIGFLLLLAPNPSAWNASISICGAWGARICPPVLIIASGQESDMSSLELFRVFVFCDILGIRSTFPRKNICGGLGARSTFPW